MRILKIFFTSLIILAVLGLVGGLIAREVVLSMAVSQIRAVAKELNTLQVEPAFTKTCLEYGGQPSGGLSLIRTQLRFVSDTEYIVEAVCQGAESLRHTYRTSALPPLVKKGRGESGLSRGQDLYGLTLSTMGRVGVVYEDDSVIHSSIQYVAENPPLTLTDGPLTTCPGYGFECCSDVTQFGQGEQQPRALDCPRSCFAACIDKPTVVAFQSDPGPAEGTQIVQLNSGQSTEFFYTVSAIGGDPLGSVLLKEEAQLLTLREKILEVVENIMVRRNSTDALEKIVITFGDGQSEEVSDLQGAVEHTYTCTRSLCVYSATIQAVTSEGITSTLTDASKIQVQVRP